MEALRRKPKKAKNPLTIREGQVLQLIAQGKSTKDVASLLGISVKSGTPKRAPAKFASSSDGAKCAPPGVTVCD